MFKRHAPEIYLILCCLSLFTAWVGLCAMVLTGNEVSEWLGWLVGASLLVSTFFAGLAARADHVRAMSTWSVR